jgi:hypothetical protein
VTLKLDATPGGTLRITGLANLGEWLTASLNWIDPPADLGATYQWQRCDVNGEACNDIPTETLQTHIVSQADLGTAPSTLRVKATVWNSFGSATLTSSAVRVLDSVQSVALLFRPYLFFDVGEHWRPLNVPDFLSEIFGDGTDHRICRRWVALFKLPRVDKRRTASITIKPGPTHLVVSARLAGRQLAPSYFGPG